MKAGQAAHFENVYSEHEDAAIRRMHRNGFTREHMSRVLGRSVDSLISRFHKLGIADLHINRNPSYQPPVPAWIPDYLREEYIAVAYEEGEHAGASWARKEMNKSRPAFKVTWLTRDIKKQEVVEVVEPPKPQKVFFSLHKKVARALRIIAATHGVTPEQIMGTSRRAAHCAARQHFMWEMKRLTKWSLVKIGRAMNRDHTSVLHALKKIEARIALRAPRIPRAGGEE